MPLWRSPIEMPVFIGERLSREYQCSTVIKKMLH